MSFFNHRKKEMWENHLRHEQLSVHPEKRRQKDLRKITDRNELNIQTEVSSEMRKDKMRRGVIRDYAKNLSSPKSGIRRKSNVSEQTSSHSFRR